jgi:hypothetical protein
MLAPDIRNTIVDKPNKVTYHILAYRRLTTAEMVQSVQMFLSQPKQRRRKTPLRNKVITILTIHGAAPGL